MTARKSHQACGSHGVTQLFPQKNVWILPDVYAKTTLSLDCSHTITEHSCTARTGPFLLIGGPFVIFCLYSLLAWCRLSHYCTAVWDSPCQTSPFTGVTHASQSEGPPHLLLLPLLSFIGVSLINLLYVYSCLSICF